MRHFKILRISHTSSLDPTKGISFEPELGSDALFFALREAFPGGLRHRDRVRSALVEFLVKEQVEEREAWVMGSSVLPSAFRTCENLGMGDDDKTCGVVQGEEVEGRDVEGFRLLSDSSTGVERRRKWRRTMTKEEKREYRKRREKGACADCKRKKRKCCHEGDGEVVERGYEGDCEVGGSHVRLGVVGLESGAALTFTDSLYHTGATGNQSSAAYALDSPTTDVTWPLSSWPASFEDTQFDAMELTKWSEDVAMWSIPFETALLPTSVDLFASQQLNLCGQMPTMLGSKYADALIHSRLQTGFNDETYHSSEEGDCWRS